MYFLKVIIVFLATLSIGIADCSRRKGEKIVPSNEYFSQHDLCESEIVRAERKYSIPHRLLMAIGTVESGYSINNSKTKRPYPWSVCIEGKSYYFSTKSAAIAAVKRIMARGKRNIDVGCMQVNLMHHKNAFRTLEEAFTPKYNVDYAARFFIELKDAYKTWTNAVCYYHSKAAKYYRPYCSSVFNTWKKVKNRVINSSHKVLQASANIRSKISFLPSYYSLIDTETSAKLHQLGRKTLTRSVPKFFVNQN